MPSNDTDERFPSPPATSRTRRAFLTTGATAVAAGLAGCTFGSGPLETERSTNVYSVAAGTELDVANTNGDVAVTAAPAEAEDIEVEVVKRTRGDRDRLDRVELTSGVTDGVLELRTEYDGLRQARVVVDLTVQVPAGHPLVTARSGNGDVTVEDVAGDATIRSGNGDVTAENVDGYPALETANGDAEATGTTGLAGARSGNGDVAVEVRRLRKDVSCASGNGDVDVGVPGDLSADVALSVGNGDIEVEGITLQNHFSGESEVTGRLGDGGPTLSCEVGNGDVRLYGLDE